MSGIDGIKGRFNQALTQTKTTGAKLDKQTLDQAVSEAALDDGVVDNFEKQEIANQFAKFKPGQVSPEAMQEFGRLQSAWGLPQASAATPVSWQTNTTPFDKASTMHLLTDGRVIAKEAGSPNWWLLSPDKNGSYANGTWTQAAPMSKDRLYFSSSVLADGRLLVVGGEYTNGLQNEDNTAEIYDPQKNTWSPVDGPGWKMVGDAASAVLPDGRVLLGSLDDNKTAIFDPKTNKWTDGGTKLGKSDEESWALMRDGSIITVDCSPERQGKSELWTPDGKGSGTWTEAGDLPVSLVEKESQEIGPAILLNDGRALFVGATGHTAIYTPGAQPGQKGTWAAGPDLPKDADGHQLIAKDAPAALLTNGHVLITAGATDGSTWDFGKSTRFFDFDPKSGVLNEVDAPQNSTQVPYQGRMLMLPTGEVAYVQQTKAMSFLSTGNAAVDSPPPTLTDVPGTAAPGDTITVAGKGFNGVSQDIGYGDDADGATNYPLARLIAADGSMQYLRTHDHASMGLGADTPNSTKVDLPPTLAEGTYQLQLVTNGVPSAGVPLVVKKPPQTDTGGTTTGGTTTGGTTTGGTTTGGATTGGTTTGGTTTGGTTTSTTTTTTGGSTTTGGGGH